MSAPITLYVQAWSATTGDPIELYRTPAGRHQGLTPVGMIEVSRSRKSPLEGPGPGTVTLQLQAPASDPVLDLGYDDRIEVTANMEGDAPTRRRLIVVCWVQSWTRTTRGGIATYIVQAQDAIGRLAGWLIGDTPWPDESVTQRGQRINDAAGEPVLDWGDWPEDWRSVAGRDVDNRSILELAQLTLAPSPIEPSGASVDAGQLPGRMPSRVLNEWGYGSAIELPSSAIADTGMVMTRGSRVSAVTVTAPPPNGGEPVSHRYTAPIAGPSATYSVESDRWGADARTLAGALRTADVTRVQLAPTRVLVDRINGDRQALLIGPYLWGEVYYLTGDLPDGHYRSQIVMGVTVRVQGGRLLDVELELLPAPACGVLRLQWREIPLLDLYRPRFGPLMHTGVRPQPDNSATWRKTRDVRIAAQP